MMTMTTTLTTNEPPRDDSSSSREKESSDDDESESESERDDDEESDDDDDDTEEEEEEETFLLQMTPRVATKGALLSLMACATITTHGTTQNFASAASSSYYGKQHLIDDRDENYIENIAGSVSSSEGDERKPTRHRKCEARIRRKSNDARGSA